MKRWLPPVAIDQGVVQELEATTHLPLLICRLLVQRGITDIDSARRFLAPKMEHLHDPFRMLGVRELVQRLLAAKERGDKIGIHGDYDVDGLTSTTLYTLVLRKLGFDVTPFVPHRMVDGYGVSVRALQQFVDTDVRVVLTCDTGFSAVEEVRKGVDEHGLEVLITDHHHPPEVLPKAHVLVNPHQRGCLYPFKDLCGAGVAFKVLQALVREMGLDEQEVLYPHLDLVALGTVCDVVPLVDENRVFVKWGIRVARDSQNLGLRTLFEVAGKPLGTVDEGTFGWIIGPRLNAVGRIDDAGMGLRLLIADDPTEARAIAEQIDRLNAERRAMSKAIEDEACRMIAAMDLDAAYGIALFSNRDDESTATVHSVVAAREAADPAGGATETVGEAQTKTAAATDAQAEPETAGVGQAEAAPAGNSSADVTAAPAPVSSRSVEWHHGVIGIVASRIVERFGRPTFLFAYDAASGKWKGSGRAPNVGRVNLYDALDACKTHLAKFGGHAHAAGATLKAKSKRDLARFAKAFNEAVASMMAPEDRIPCLKADLEVRLADLTDELYRMLGKFAPFGHGNEAINMIARNVQILSARAIGSDHTHLKLEVAQHGATFEAVGWGFATRFPEILDGPKPYTADLFFRLRENTYQGQFKLQLELQDLRLHEEVQHPHPASPDQQIASPPPATLTSPDHPIDDTQGAGPRPQRSGRSNGSRRPSGASDGSSGGPTAPLNRLHPKRLFA